MGLGDKSIFNSHVTLKMGVQVTITYSALHLLIPLYESLLSIKRYGADKLLGDIVHLETGVKAKKPN